MPFNWNGFGTALCEGRGFVTWDANGGPDCDGIEAVCLLYFPVSTYKTIHISRKFNDSGFFSGMGYQQFPIKSSSSLYWKAAIHETWMYFFFIGVMMALMGGAIIYVEKTLTIGLFTLTAIGIALVIIAFMDHFNLIRDKRDQDLRKVLGRREHGLGSSDPATWLPEILNLVRPAEELFGTKTYAEAAQYFLKLKQYEPSMLAARFSVAIEDAQRGEELTDEILADPLLQDVLAQMRKDIGLRQNLLATEKDWSAEAIFKVPMEDVLKEAAKHL